MPWLYAWRFNRFNLKFKRSCKYIVTLLTNVTFLLCMFETQTNAELDLKISEILPEAWNFLSA